MVNFLLKNLFKELFVQFGALRKVNILYNRAGLSSGTAELIYLRPEDAKEARDQYDGVPLDGMLYL